MAGMLIMYGKRTIIKPANNKAPYAGASHNTKLLVAEYNLFTA